MDAQRRIEVLETALAEYIAKYGFTEKARAAMIRSGSSSTNLDADSVHGGDDDGDRSQAG